MNKSFQPLSVAWKLFSFAMPISISASLLYFFCCRKDLLEKHFVGEASFAELGTVTFLLFAIAVGLYCIYSAFKYHANPLIKAYTIVMTLGCIYFAGEEASWGQHLAHWRTPETWAVQNKHAETNLHNLTNKAEAHLFEKLPRIGVICFAFLVGGILPLYFVINKKKLKIKKSLGFIGFAKKFCIPASLCVSFITVTELVLKAMDFPYRPDRKPFHEAIECLLGLFLFIYLVSVYTRLKESRKLDS